MPIPPFDHNQVLPPHLGDPKDPSQLNPYRTSMLELVQAFGSSPARLRILSGLLDFRREIMKIGVLEGFQLLDGSFLTHVESVEKRDPNDIDVITFIWGESVTNLQAVIGSRSDLLAGSSKVIYHVDNHWVTDTKPSLAFEQAVYWTSLFSHNRGSVWKGMLRLEIGADQTDADAVVWLQKASEQGGGTK